MHLSRVLKQLKRQTKRQLKQTKQPDYCALLLKLMVMIFLTNILISFYLFVLFTTSLEPQRPPRPQLQHWMNNPNDVRSPLHKAAKADKAAIAAKAAPRKKAHCDTCNLHIDANTMKRHLAGKRHKKRVEYLASYCRVCKIYCNKVHLLRNHERGSKHQKILRQKNLLENRESISGYVLSKESQQAPA